MPWQSVSSLFIVAGMFNAAAGLVLGINYLAYGKGKELGLTSNEFNYRMDKRDQYLNDLIKAYNTLVFAFTPHTSSQRTVLVTGGAGYIGSHTCLELLNVPGEQYKVVVLDNLENSSEESLHRVRDIVQCSPDRLQFRHCDIRDRKGLEEILDEFPEIDSCIHFAGLKAVGESVSHPLNYYDTNVAGTIHLLRALVSRNIKRFVFSSSATVYGDPESLPLQEMAQLRPTNPYGHSKVVVENILQDLFASDENMNILILRYFNPVGAHPSGKIGEDPQGTPNNLMPYISQVCVGRRMKLSIFGDDYDTPDGTGVRDYIHVVDLAKGHVSALNTLYSSRLGCEIVNLGTGIGVSVLDLLRAMERATGKHIPFQMTSRRPGDVAAVYADPHKAEQLLGWKATLGVDDMCRDAWKWQSRNPWGYQRGLPSDET
eukprot:Nitzschia sp. Nitz4//scaffold43_size134323//16482//18362//NITZ4_003279-RA/size134323-augustus-gene-0.85-mRNA-1//1//CDS//3329551888//2699//frame0